MCYVLISCPSQASNYLSTHLIKIGDLSVTFHEIMITSNTDPFGMADEV